MKVCVITGSYIPNCGEGRHARIIVEKLRSKGVEVVVLSPDGGDDEVVRLKPLGGAFDLIANAAVARKLAHDCDVVHALDAWPWAVYGHAATFATNKKLFINGIGSYSVVPLYSSKKAWMLKRAYQQARAVFSISQYTEQLEQLEF